MKTIQLLTIEDINTTVLGSHFVIEVESGSLQINFDLSAARELFNDLDLFLNKQHPNQINNGVNAKTES